MTAQHTPGPWTLEIDDNCLHPWLIVDSSPNKIPICLLNPNLEDGESAANSRLIAAAPELFSIVLDEASLYAGMDADEFTPSTAARIKAMRSIIARVTGETTR